MARRRAVPKQVETDLLIASHRRCCLCFYLDGFEGVKKGQVTHLNKQPDDNRSENLVWLCLEHHDSYDSVTSQSKNFTQSEVTKWRDKLHAHFAERSTTAPSEPIIDAPLQRRGSDRPWHSPWFSTSIGPQLFPFRSRNRVDGVCVVERIPLEDDRVVVACISVPGNPGSSITNNVETICEQACLQFEIEPEEVVWLENYDYINPTEWLHVTFRTMPPDQWGDPEWTEMTQSMWQDLGLRPVARLRSSHGELISKLRKVRRRA